MITSTLPSPALRDSGAEGASIDAEIRTVRRGPGQLDHTLTLRATRGAASIWTKEITLAVDAPFEVPDLETADAFVIASLFPAMEIGGELRVHGKVSRTLIRNVLDFQAAWRTAIPSACRGFALTVDEVDDAPPAPEVANPKAILAFSGGLDSMLALCRNVSGDAGTTGHDIGATLMIHARRFGVGVAPDSSDLIGALRETSARWDRPLAVVHTNMPLMVGRDSISHGTWLAACLTLFSGRFDVGLLGSSVPYYSPGYEVHGTQPLSDRLLSSAQMSIRNDEGLYSRVEKVALLAGYPDALKDLRVCIHPYRSERNCCRCEKCIRTMLCFVATGNPIPKCFPDGLNLDDIGIGMGQSKGLSYARIILDHARRAATMDEEPMQVLRHRYRQKKMKIAAKDALRRLTAKKPRHRWHVVDEL